MFIEQLPAALSLAGLVLDIIGFSLIGWSLLKHPGNRLFYGGGDREARIDRAGFVLVIFGFVLQAAAQCVELLS